MLATHLQTVISQCFADPDMLTGSLFALLVDRYGTEFLDWEFETLEMELRDDYQVTLPEVNREKLQALTTIVTTDSFFRDPVIFSHCASAMCNEPVNFDNNTPIEPDTAAWAAFEAVTIIGNEHPPFDEQVQRYLGAVLQFHGIHRKPKTLSFAILDDDAEAERFPAIDSDPVLSAGLFKRNAEETNAVDQFVESRFSLLMDQIGKLPLQNRNEESWNKLLSKLARK